LKLRLSDENVTCTICSVLISSGCGQGQSPREADPKRKLLEEDDFSFMLFGLLKEVFLQLASETTHSWGDPRLACMADQLTLIDDSLIPALPRMHWALWQIATTDLSMDFSMNSARWEPPTSFAFVISR
jgi:hypothetical protein